MPDKRHAPARCTFGERQGRVGVWTDSDGVQHVRITQETPGNTANLVIDRSAGRKLRDWLNHYLEYVAEVEAEPQPLTEGWASPIGSAVCHYFDSTKSKISACGNLTLTTNVEYLQVERFAPVCQSCARIVEGR